MPIMLDQPQSLGTEVSLVSNLHIDLTSPKRGFSSFRGRMPKSDQCEISPYSINSLENRVVMRVEYMVREDASN